ncbi:MAG: poly(A) polymerase, partial [Variovorax sp.]|nr:poly(A) polymerase [Variovorax sp.]
PLLPSLRLLDEVPQSRLFDEMLKLLQTGHAVATVAQLRLLGLAKGIYPLLDIVVERAEQPFVKAALQDTDRRVGEGKAVAPSFLLACVLWADVRQGWAERIEGRHGQRGLPPFPALQDAIDDVFNARIGDVSGRGKLAADMREIWMMQPRFDKRSGATPYSLVEQARFRAAFDFMRLRADVGEVTEEIAAWWQEFSTAGELQRQDLLEQVREEQKRGQRVHARVPGRATAASRSDTDVAAASGTRAEATERSDEADSAPGAAEGEGSPRKRRRRRKPRTPDEGGREGAAGRADAPEA